MRTSQSPRAVQSPGIGAETWTYDGHGRVATDTVGNVDRQTRYIYDDDAAAGGRETEEDRYTSGAENATVMDDANPTGYSRSPPIMSPPLSPFFAAGGVRVATGACAAGLAASAFARVLSASPFFCTTGPFRADGRAAGLTRLIVAPVRQSLRSPSPASAGAAASANPSVHPQDHPDQHGRDAASLFRRGIPAIAATNKGNTKLVGSGTLAISAATCAVWVADRGVDCVLKALSMRL